jgi:hypothetical protein
MKKKARTNMSETDSIWRIHVEGLSLGIVEASSGWVPDYEVAIPVSTNSIFKERRRGRTMANTHTADQL